MEGDTPTDRLRENAAGVASILVTGVWLAALLTGQSWWLVALIVGYVVVVPIVAMLFEPEADREEDDRLENWWHDTWDSVRRFETGEGYESPTESETPLETLRRRYAAGELTEEQFERKLERLLETETLEDVEDEAARRRLREPES